MKVDSKLIKKINKPGTPNSAQ